MRSRALSVSEPVWPLVFPSRVVEIELRRPSCAAVAATVGRVLNEAAYSATAISMARFVCRGICVEYAEEEAIYYMTLWRE